jgi:hypothetical protein
MSYPDNNRFAKVRSRRLAHAVANMNPDTVLITKDSSSARKITDEDDHRKNKKKKKMAL